MIGIITGVFLLGSLPLSKLSAQCQGFAVDITSNPPPPHNLCPGQTITLISNVTGGTPPYSYLWSTGETTPNIVITPPYNGSVPLAVTDANGCLAENSIHVKASVWEVDFIFNGWTYCMGDSMELFAYPDFPAGTTFLWSTGATTPSIFITNSGTYSLTATSPGGQCNATNTEFVQMSFFPTPTPNISGTTVLCPGQNGTLTASGAPGDTYAWSTGAGTPSITISSPGTYSVTVTNDSGCTGTDAVVVTSGSSTNPNISAPASLCPGQSGIVAVTNAGSFTDFLWSTGATTSSITINGPGTYSVTVTSTGGCTTTGSAVVNSGNPNTTLTGNTTAVTSCTSPNGAVDLTITPSGTYTFLWSNGATSEDLVNIGPGTYTVTVTEGSGCTNTASFTVTNNTPAPNLTASPTASTCGQPNGAVDLTVSPAGAYTFVWSNGTTTEDISGVAAGTYSVIVTATTSSCTATTSATVTNNNPPINISGTVSPVTSCTASNGSIDITATPSNTYTFIWSNGATTEDLVNVAAGTYIVTVSAGGSCINSASFTVNNNIAPPVPIATPTAATCGQNNGAVDLTVSPTGTYTFLWSNGETTQNLTGVGGGTYQVTVTSTGSGCTATTGATVADNTFIPNITGSASPVTSCTTPNGGVTISVSPSGSYSYTWSNGETTQNISGLAPGTFTVTVTAGGNCINSAGFTVTSNTSNPALTETITPAVCGDPNGAIELSVSPSGSYGFLWSNGDTTQNLTGIAAGNYSVIVTGSNGCTATGNYNVPNNSSSFSLAGVTAPVTTCSTPNGEVDLTVSPSETYSFLWSNGATSEDLTGVAAGTYSVTVTQAGSCTGEASFAVANTTVIPSLSQNITSASCGQNNGAIDLTVTPSGSYTFLWSNGETTQNLTNVGGGTYQVIVTSTTSGCSSTASATVADNTVIPNITGSTSPVTSCTTPNGSVTISVSPSGSYSYTWSNGETTQNISGLAPGTFTVTVTAGGNCINSAGFTVTSNTSNPALTETITPAVCGDPNGAIELSVSPSGSYGFLWSNGDTTQNLTGIAAGNYSVIVTGSNGCTATGNYNVPNNSSSFSLAGVTAPVTTCSTPNGEVDLTVSPSETYSFLWSNGATSEDLTGVAAGTYSVTVTQAGSCTGEASFAVANTTVIPSLSQNITPASCGQNNGAIDLTVTPATGNTFLWSNGETTEDLQNLAAGTYTVICTDANGCTSTLSVEVPAENPALSLTTMPTANTSCISPNGSIDLTVTASGAVTFIWSNGETSEDLQNLLSGTYTVTVTDDLGCTETAAADVQSPVQPQVTVTGPASACQGQPAMLTAGGGFASYLWSNGATTSSINVSQTGVYSVTATDANGCTATSGQPFQSLPLPSPVINGPAAICGGSAVFSVTGGVFTQINWSTGETTSNITISQTGTYTVTVNNATGCTASATQSLDVGTYLLPVIATTATGCNGTATLDAGTGYASYLWSDGSTAQILQVNANGTYSVTVSDGTGCTGEDAVSVPLPVSPQVQISGVSSICQGSSTQFSVPNGFAQILWSTGAATPVITVSQPAVYGVTVTDANGCTASAYQSLTVGPGLLPDISVMLTSCDGTSSLDVGGGFATYLWSNGSTAPAITVSANGTYSVTVSDASGCTGTASENVVLPNPPTVQVVGAASLCQGDQTVLAAPGNFTQYLWSTGETTPQITIFQGGLYSVTVSDANGCMASADWTVAQLLTNLVTLQASACSPQDTGTVQMVFTNQSGCDSVVVTVISLAPPIFTQVQLSACEGESADFNGVSIPAGSSQDFVFAAANGCDSIVSVNVAALPAVNFDLAATRTCHDASEGEISVSNLAGLAPFLFSIDGGALQGQPIFNNLPGGSHSVLVEDANGCRLVRDIAVEETVPLELLVQDTVLSCESGVAILRPIVVSGNLAAIAWTWEDGSENPWRLVSETGIYKVVADDGCDAVERSINVTWDDDYRRTDFFYIPNCFSPNGDGVNDEFRVYPGKGFEVLSFEFRIFDRWGDEMFVTFDPADSWNGIFRDIERQPAVYVWFVKAQVLVCGTRVEDVFREGGVRIMR